MVLSNMNPILTFCTLALISSSIHCNPISDTCISVSTSVDSTVKYLYAEVYDSNGDLSCVDAIENTAENASIQCDTKGVMQGMYIYLTNSPEHYYSYDTLFPHEELCTQEPLPAGGAHAQGCTTSVEMIASGFHQLVIKSQTQAALFGKPAALWTCWTAYVEPDYLITADHQFCMAKLDQNQERVIKIHGFLSQALGTTEERTNDPDKVDAIFNTCTNLLINFGGIEPPSQHELGKLHVQKIDNCASFMKAVPKDGFQGFVDSWLNVLEGVNNKPLDSYIFCRDLSELIDFTDHDKDHNVVDH